MNKTRTNSYFSKGKPVKTPMHFFFIAILALAAFFMIVLTSQQKEKPVACVEQIIDHSGSPKSDALYKPVELRDVIKNSATDKVNYVKAKGTVVGNYPEWGNEFLIEDEANSYVLVVTCRACATPPLFEKGTYVEVSGVAMFTRPEDSKLKERLNLTQDLPEEIGMIMYDEVWEINRSCS